MSPQAPAAPADELADELADVAVIGRALDHAVVFCHVSVSRWRGHKSVEEAVVQVGGHDTDTKIITTPRWKLLDDSWQTRFAKVEHDLRFVVSAASPAFAIPGVYVIPRLRAHELFETIDNIVRERFQPLVEEFVAGWHDYRGALRSRVSAAQWEQIDKALPRSLHALRAHFHVVKHVIPLAGSGSSLADLTCVYEAAHKAFGALHDRLVHNETDAGFFASSVARFRAVAEPLLKRQELAGPEADAFAGAISEATRKFVTDTALAITQSLQDELLAAVDNLAYRLDAKGVVRDSTIGMVEAAFDKFRSFSFAATPMVLARMQEVRTKLNELSFQELNRNNRHGDRTAATGLADLLKKFRADVDKELSGGTNGLGRRLRQIDI